MILTCAVCGKEFDAIRSSMKYCSARCRYFAMNSKPAAKERRKRYDDAHKEQASARAKEKYKNLSVEQLAQEKIRAHEYYIRTKYVTLARNKNWKVKNKEYYKEYCRNYHAKYNATEHGKSVNINKAYRRRKYMDTLTPIDYSAVRERFDKLGNRCVACGATNNITIDHIIPLAKGGTNCIDNLQPLCHSCNSSKGVKSMDEFMKGRKRYNERTGN